MQLKVQNFEIALKKFNYKERNHLIFIKFNYICYLENNFFLIKKYFITYINKCLKIKNNYSYSFFIYIYFIYIRSKLNISKLK